MAAGEPGVDLLFESAWLKWGQAIVHSQTLQRDIEARTSDGGLDPVLAFHTEYHPKRHGFAVIVDELRPMPVVWRLLMGDIANNYRAALDHLAWALVTRGRTPPAKLTKWQEEAVYFPIYEDRLKYNASLAKKLPGVRRADAAKVRWCQPYRTGARNRPRQPFAILASINSGDKHRTIQPLWAFPSVVETEVTDTRDCAILVQGPSSGRGHALQVGTEVAFLPGRKLGDNPEIDVNLKITAHPTLDDRVGLDVWGQWTGVFIFALLRQFSAQPPHIHEIGAELIPLPPAWGHAAPRAALSPCEP